VALLVVAFLWLLSLWHVVAAFVSESGCTGVLTVIEGCLSEDRTPVGPDRLAADAESKVGT
jgi:hypothetical protein